MDLKSDPYMQLPNNRDHSCFGCSPLNPSGLQMTFYTNETAVYSKVTVPEHLCGWNNLVHGGVLSTILDEIMSWATIYLLKQVPMTKSISVDFLKPVYVGNPLKAEGTVLDKKGKHEALMEGRIYNKDDVCCAKATGTFAVFSPAVAKRLRITDSESLKWFEQIFNLK
ncbi:MAG: PaaI family thioesterase [Desulfobacterales bacterium]